MTSFFHLLSMLLVFGSQETEQFAAAARSSLGSGATLAGHFLQLRQAPADSGCSEPWLTTEIHRLPWIYY